MFNQDVTAESSINGGLGKYEKTVEDEGKIESGGSGSGSNPSITLVKRDAENVSNTLAGATFQLFFIRDGAQVPVTDRIGREKIPRPNK